jgi:hypothetical protein
MLRMSYLISRLWSVKTVPFGRSVGMMFLFVHVKVAPGAIDVSLNEVAIDVVDTAACELSVELGVDVTETEVDDVEFEVAPSEVEDRVDAVVVPVKLSVELACDPQEETVVVVDVAAAISE